MKKANSKFDMNPTFVRGAALASIAAATTAIIAVKEINPSSLNLFPICPLHAITGLNCPGCGATRGMHALLNGDVLTALHFNAMLVVFVPLMIYGIAALLSFGIRGKGLPAPPLTGYSLWILLVLLLAFGVARNLPFYPFSLLAI